MTVGLSPSLADCAPGLLLMRGSCVTLCPDGFFPSLASSRPSCLKCHYSCRTCVSASNCTSCFSDAQLHRTRCFATELVDEVTELERWYTAVSAGQSLSPVGVPAPHLANSLSLPLLRHLGSRHLHHHRQESSSFRMLDDVSASGFLQVSQPI